MLLGTSQSRVCEQLAQSRYLTVERPGVKLATFQLGVQHTLTITPPSCVIACNVTMHLFADYNGLQ